MIVENHYMRIAQKYLAKVPSLSGFSNFTKHYIVLCFLTKFFR